jgi:membrane protease YdiL (CAAX protease family)
VEAVRLFRAGWHEQTRITFPKGIVAVSTIATFEVPTEDPLLTRPEPVADVRAELRPWGFWGSLGWGLLALAAGLLASLVYAFIWSANHRFAIPSAADQALGTAIGTVMLIVSAAVLVIPVKRRHYSLSDYFALNDIPHRDLALGIAGLIALIVVFEAMERLLGIDAGSESVAASYRAMKLAGALPALWLTVVIVAPVTEELIFRGFLHRGWAPSWLGISGTIILTSALWAAMHQQYNWSGILCVFSIGLLLGWIRQRSASTTLTILLHALNNAVAMVLITIHVELLS